MTVTQQIVAGQRVGRFSVKPQQPLLPTLMTIRGVSPRVLECAVERVQYAALQVGAQQQGGGCVFFSQQLVVVLKDCLAVFALAFSAQALTVIKTLCRGLGAYCRCC